MQYVIGDVHGQLYALEALVAAVQRQDSDAVFYFVGDFVDRGPYSKQVVDLVLNLDAKSVRGNHDDIFDLIVNGTAATNNGEEANEAAKQCIWFMNFGMVETLKSYGVPEKAMTALVDAYDKTTSSTVSAQNMWDEGSDDEAVEDALNVIRDYIPDNHKKFFRDLPISITKDDFFLTHAKTPIKTVAERWVRKIASASLSEKNDAVWGRFDMFEIKGNKDWGKTGFFGHTPTKAYGSRGTPVTGPDIVLLDTGVTFGDKLTAWCIETRKYYQSDRHGNISDGYLTN